jgi:hypothetical protein
MTSFNQTRIKLYVHAIIDKHEMDYNKKEKKILKNVKIRDEGNSKFKYFMNHNRYINAYKILG